MTIENRYIVVKVGDTDPDTLSKLTKLLDNNSIPVRSGIFIERDWDCYEEAFDLLQRHINRQKEKQNVWVK